MLMGEEDTQHQSVLQSAPFMFGCLAKAMKDATLTRQAVSTALASATLKPFLEHLSGQQLAWLQRHMQLTADSVSNEVTQQPKVAGRLDYKAGCHCCPCQCIFKALPGASQQAAAAMATTSHAANC